MSAILVAGLGSELRGDDAAGLLAARALARLCPRGIDVEEHQGDVPALAESMSRHEQVVVIDAVAGGGEPGRILRLTPESAVLRAATSSHGLGLREAVALAGVLGSAPAVHVFGITGGRFELGAAPCPEVVRAAAEVAVQIKEQYPCA